MNVFLAIPLEDNLPLSAAYIISLAQAVERVWNAIPKMQSVLSTGTTLPKCAIIMHMLFGPFCILVA